MSSISRVPLIVAMLAGLLPVCGHAEVRVGSTRAATSPDKGRQVVVDHLMPVVDGELDRFSGKMLVRVLDADGTTTLRRQVETSQVSVIQTPRWLNGSVAAFFYNIKKNANGTVFLEADSGEAVQVESVATSRRRGVTGRTETELTSLEVVFYGRRVERVSNVTRAGASVFPLVLKPFPPAENAPLPLSVYEDVRAAMTAWAAFEKTHGLDRFQVEVASESFSPDDKYAAGLACADGKPVLFVVPLGGASAADTLQATVMVPLGAEVVLNCATDARDANGEREEDDEAPPMEEGEFGGFRFSTAWKDAQTIQVVRETFETEDQPLQKEPFFEVTVAGQKRELPRTDTVPDATRRDDNATTAATTY